MVGFLGPLAIGPALFQELLPPQVLAPCILFLIGEGGEEPVGTCSDLASCLFPRALPGCHYQKSSTPK